MFWRRTGQAHAHPQIRSSPSPTAAETDAVRRKKNNKKGVVAGGTEAQGAAGPPASASTAETTTKQAVKSYQPIFVETRTRQLKSKCPPTVERPPESKRLRLADASARAKNAEKAALEALKAKQMLERERFFSSNCRRRSARKSAGPR